MRRYAEDIFVETEQTPCPTILLDRRDESVDGFGPEAVGSGRVVPVAFVWRGRRYAVRRVLRQWQERRAWWREAVDGIPEDDRTGGGEPVRGIDAAAYERMFWRLEACPGRALRTGVFDVAADARPDGLRRWHLVRVLD